MVSEKPVDEDWIHHFLGNCADVGDKQMQAEGKMDKAKGKLESAIGGAKDTLREQLDKR